MEKLVELAQAIGRYVPSPGISSTAIPRLSLFRVDQPSVPTPAVYEASLCLIAQGAKRVSLGEQSVVYDASRYLLVSVDLPLVGHVLEATAEAPYLCCKIDLDLAALAELMAAERGGVSRGDLPVLAVYPSDADLIDAAYRLVRLLDRPESIPVLAPLIEREILYRLVTGPHGAMLRHLMTAGTRLNQVGRAIAAIRKRYDAQLRIDDVAAEAGMSTSSLHAHFKAITQMTPLEYQKQIRLQEARRLMLANGASAGTAGFIVGYESPSQFSREYRRLFGAPPRQDVERLRSIPDYGAAV